MKGTITFLGVFACLLIAAIIFFRLNFYDLHVRYRLTVEVMNGGQTEVGSSVVEALYVIEPNWLWSGPNNHTRVIGYAPTVDLGDKKLLFLTFRDAFRNPQQAAERSKNVICARDDLYCLPFKAYALPGTVVLTDNGNRKASLDELLRHSGPRDVPFSALPDLIRFFDADGEHRYVHISPYDLASSFGPGVELKRVVLQLTNDPITAMPKTWPEWLKQSQNEAEVKGYNHD